MIYVKQKAESSGNKTKQPAVNRTIMIQSVKHSRFLLLCMLLKGIIQ